MGLGNRIQYHKNLLSTLTPRVHYGSASKPSDTHKKCITSQLAADSMWQDVAWSCKVSGHVRTLCTYTF